MRVMLFTGYINYETFSDSDYNLDNPIQRGTVYDVSTPRGEQVAKTEVLRSAAQAGFRYPTLVEAPPEPTFTLQDLKDPERVEKITAGYKIAVTEYEKLEKFSESCNQVLELLDELLDDEEVPEISSKTLDALWSEYLRYSAQEENAVPRVYFFEVKS